MLAATGLTPLLVNLESMTAKPKAGRVTKKAVHYFVHTDKDSVTANGSEPQLLEGCLTWDAVQSFLQTLLSSAWPENGGGCRRHCIFKVRAN